MRAVGFLKSLPITEPESLFETDMSVPTPGDCDLLVAIEAISVNPADAKVRIRTAVDHPHDAPYILGFDAVGVVEAVGKDVTGFRKGDRVWYAGDPSRPGSYAEMQLVDFRIAALAPSSVAPVAAAAMPLVSLTAFEMLFDRLQVPQPPDTASLLVIGGAGGVGSVTLQLARHLTALDITATASRPETKSWCLQMGAHDVVDHRDLVAAYRASGREYADFICQYADTAMHWDAMCALIAPQGRIGTIVETPEKLDISALQGKSAALMWELMFTRPMFATADMARQGQILSHMARLVDDGSIRTTETRTLQGLGAQTLKEAHALIETGRMIGKLVVEY
ncbi:zinc-binding alcohol dehydrogenase family protein [Actibacterium mucosum]|uniref:zinc-binding alcohol dehydrogenase family protein n=1 Tax=Actibacterium mucosum TaxID=1087332 RepID=UPI000553966B|nr:zinc-binding alcohol dehydrogenase family protein [Actibacterium mucosum]